MRPWLASLDAGRFFPTDSSRRMMNAWTGNVGLEVFKSAVWISVRRLIRKITANKMALIVAHEFSTTDQNSIF